MPDRYNLRALVRGAYDIQLLRIQTGNRLVANFKAKLGLPPSEKEETLDAKGKRILADLRAEFRRLTDGITTLPGKVPDGTAALPKKLEFKNDGLIDSYSELCLIAQYEDLDSVETRHFRLLGGILKEFPIYTEYLQGVRGVGPAMAGVLISEIDIYKAEYPSSLWKLAGLDTGPDGKGRSRRAEHLVKRHYIDKNGEEKEKLSITFNPWLKTKLFVLGSSFIRLGDNPYRTIYDNYKHRLENHPKWKETTKGHRHMASIRYMLKMFLISYYENARRLEGLPVAPPYSEAKLGIVHKKAG